MHKDATSTCIYFTEFPLPKTLRFAGPIQCIEIRKSLSKAHAQHASTPLHPAPFFASTQYHRRLFGWAGQVLRMPMDRLPRKLLTAWLPCKRAVGVMHNWGNTLNKALTSKGVTTTFHKLSTLTN